MATVKKNVELKRVNMNLPSNLVQRIEEYAVDLGVNTTAAYIFLLNQALDYKDTMSNLPIFMQMFNEFKDIQANNENDEDLED